MSCQVYTVDSGWDRQEDCCLRRQESKSLKMLQFASAWSVESPGYLSLSIFLSLFLSLSLSLLSLSLVSLSLSSLSLSLCLSLSVSVSVSLSMYLSEYAALIHRDDLSFTVFFLCSGETTVWEGRGKEQVAALCGGRGCGVPRSAAGTLGQVWTHDGESSAHGQRAGQPPPFVLVAKMSVEWFTRVGWGRGGWGGKVYAMESCFIPINSAVIFQFY